MATRLEEYRGRFPEYADVDDARLSKALHQKYFEDEEFDQFQTRLNEARPDAPAPEQEGFSRPGTEEQGTGVGDAARTLSGGLLESTAGAVEAVGETSRKSLQAFGDYSNFVLGTDIQVPNLLTPFARPLRAGGEALKAGVSTAGQEALQGSTPRADIFKGEFDLGEDPSLSGYGLQLANLVGQMAPALATAVATKGRSTADQLMSTAAVTAAQGGGAALHEESNRIRELPQQELNRMPGYIDLVAEKGNLEEAREELAVQAGRSAFNVTAPVSAASGLLLGGGLSRPVQNFMQRLVGQSAIARGAATAVAEAPLEGLQEVAEGVAQRAGGALATGEDRDLGEGTGAELVLGALGGGFGGSLAAFQRPDGGGPTVSPTEPAPLEFEPDVVDAEGLPQLPPPGADQTFTGEVDFRGQPSGPNIVETNKVPISRRLPAPGIEQEFTGEQPFVASPRGSIEGPVSAQQPGFERPRPDIGRVAQEMEGTVQPIDQKPPLPKITEVPQTDRVKAAKVEKKRLDVERESLLARNREIQDRGLALPEDQRAAFFDDENVELSANFDLMETNKRSLAAAEDEALTAQREALADHGSIKQPAVNTTQPDAAPEAVPDTEIGREVEAAYAEINQPAPTPEEAASTTTITADLEGLEGDELTAEIRQLRDDELLERAGFEAPITDETTGEFLDPHQARVAQGKFQREVGLEEDRRALDFTDEQVAVLRANQVRRTKVEEDRDPTFEGFFRRGERHRTVQRAQKWAEQTDSKAIYVEADIRNLGGLNSVKGTAGADKILNETGQAMLRRMEEVGADKVIPIRRGGDEISFVIIGGDPVAVQSAIDTAEADVDTLAASEGLTDLAHTKTGREAGYGIIGALSEIVPGAKIEDIYSAADFNIEERKKTHGQPTKTETTGVIAPGEQAGRTGEGVAPGTAAIASQIGQAAADPGSTQPNIEFDEGAVSSTALPAVQQKDTRADTETSRGQKPPEEPDLSSPAGQAPTTQQTARRETGRLKQARRFAGSENFKRRVANAQGDSVAPSVFTAAQQSLLDSVVERKPDGNYDLAELQGLTVDDKKPAAALADIVVQYEAIDENGDDVTVEGPASEALSEADQYIENIRKFRECLLK